MAYTNPVDPSPGSLIRSTDQIVYVNENIRYFFSGRPIDRLLYSKGSDISFNNTAWAIVDAGATKGVTINSTRALVRASFRARMSAGGAGTQWGYFDIAMDGVRNGHATFGLATIGSLQQNGDALTIEAYFTGVTPGLRTFTLMAKYLAGTATGGAIFIPGTGSNDHQPLNMIIHEF